MVTGLNFARAEDAEKIIFGQSVALTGPIAKIGVQLVAGAKLHFDQVNAQGGIGGKMIELRSMDDGYEPERSAKNTKKLITEGVFGMFGYLGTPTSVASLPMVIEAKLPFLMPVTGAMALRDPFNKYIFNLRASYDDETELIVKHLTTLGLTKIAVAYQNDGYGKAGLSGIKQALSHRALETVAEALVERNSSDISGAVKTLLAAKPDVIIQVLVYNGAVPLIKEIKKAGYGGSLYALSFVGSAPLMEGLGPLAEGISVSQVMPSPWDMKQSVVREFAAAIKASGDKIAPNFSTIEGYISARLLTQGLSLAGAKLTRESFMAALETMNNKGIGNFSINLSASSHSASKFVEMTMLTRDGKIRV